MEFVFAKASDFEAIERQILRRGIDLQRTEAGDGTGVGIAWKANAKIRGKPWNFQARIASMEPPNGYTATGATEGLSYTAVVELMALSRSRTRMMMSVDLKPTTLTARLLLQSVKLAKSTLTTKFNNRVEAFAKDIEERYEAQG